MKARLQVLKFGGTSVGDAVCIARTAQIIAKAAKENACVAVVSAMSGVTNRLIEAAKKAQAGDAREATAMRSEERRVGKECRARWAREHEKKRKREGANAR